MAVTDDLIDFSIIETQKENIQAIPSGRSAKSLASVFSPVALKSPTYAQDANDGIRRLYEQELEKIDELDDPLDVYDRYVKWTLNTYPSAQATPQSQLLPLLERATKAFLSSPQYKNDLRYLKLWLHYIRFFSDAPKEHFAYLARHNIGEGLALFYEEFAAWLESAGRWAQAEEIYNLGVDHQARPKDRLLRKFAEFQHRYDARPQDTPQPTSPALPTVRPALAAKIDPFAPAVSRDPQASGPTAPAKVSRKAKLEIFSDGGEETRPASEDSSRGWENIGSVADRKKENTISAKPWAGEKLEGGRSNVGIPKMTIFKDQSSSITEQNHILPSRDRNSVNPRTGKPERVFVDLEAIYPDPSDPSREFCFEELRAAKRGWLQRDWRASPRPRSEVHSAPKPETSGKNVDSHQLMPLNDENDENAPPDAARRQADIARKLRQEEKANRTRKIKIKEVRGETQTIQTNLSSPKGPKLKRKKSAEPTMTIHTKVATDEIYEIFNQPLKQVDESESTKSEDESDDDDEDDYTSGGESTGTGRISCTTSEFGDDAQEDLTSSKSIAEETSTGTGWSDFTTSKHVPKHSLDEDETTATNTLTTTSEALPEEITGTREEEPDEQDENGKEEAQFEDVVTPTSPQPSIINAQTRYVPIPPEDFEVPTKPFRDPAQGAQHRLPFMTPIVEKTESSIGTSTARHDKEYATMKTPCPRADRKNIKRPNLDDEPWSSPFQEVLDDAITESKKVAPTILEFEKPKVASNKPNQVLKTGFKDQALDAKKGPLIKDTQCNPMDHQIRQTILNGMHPPLSSYDGYFKYDTAFTRNGDIRKFCKLVSNSKSQKCANEKTLTNLSTATTLTFPNVEGDYTIRRQIGEGAFAPVYLAERNSSSDESTVEDENVPSKMNQGAFASIQRNQLEAIKVETDPPSAWEFYMLRTAKRRLGVSRASESIIDVYEMHLFHDEGYLVEEYRDHGTLLDLVNAARDQAVKEGATAVCGLDEPLAMWYTVELLRTVEALHKHGLIHGDLKADNILVRLPPAAHPSAAPCTTPFRKDGSADWAARGITLIDFGRAIDMRAFPPAVAFIADWPTSPADCPEMRAARPWTFHADYHGLAAVAHTLLFGKYLDAVPDKDGLPGGPAGTTAWRLREPLKRWWAADVWAPLFALLLNPARAVAREDGARLPLLRGLRECREAMEEWLVLNGERGVGLRAGLRRLEERVRERKGR